MGHGVPELVLESNGQTWTLDASRSYSLGRDPQADVVFVDARVSWRHATIRWGERSWVFEDLGSTNGTFVQGQRVQQTEVGPGSAVHLGNATDGPGLSFSAAAAPQPVQQPYAQAQMPAPAPAQMQQTPAQAQASAAPPQQQPAAGSWGTPPAQVPRQHPPQYQTPAPQQQLRPQQPGGGQQGYSERSPTSFH